MATATSTPVSRPISHLHAKESALVKAIFIGTTVVFLTVFLVLPLVLIFYEALSKGVAAYFQSFTDRAMWSAIKMTLIAAGISVPLNLVFGLAASWAIAKFNFPGKSLLITLIDLPFAVSPVISGMVFVLVFGKLGWFGPTLEALDVKIIHAVPGIVLATIFVTFPFVARELIPLMQEQGTEEEQAALVLGASGWQMFWRVTLPNIRWALLYGVILANARAMGEFGAVSVVSANVRGKTNTLPLHIESLYNDFTAHSAVSAFAAASLLAMLALVTLVIKTMLEYGMASQQRASLEPSAAEE